MAILDTIGLESNKLFKINFNGGDLSSDGGLLLIREFAAKIGFIRLINKFLRPMILQTAVYIRTRST